MSHFAGPQKKTAVKLMTYESGMDPIGDARQHVDVKFYLIAMLWQSHTILSLNLSERQLLRS